MHHPNAFLEKLASSSLRRNKGLLVLGALALLLLGISFLGVQRMVDEQRDTLQFHFARLMENIHEQEVFLGAISRESSKGQLNPKGILPPYLQQPLPEEGPNIYLGRGLRFSLPYSVKINPDKIAASQHPKIFALGAYLAAYYSAFWAASHYHSPQVFLINGPDNFDLTVPATGRTRGGEQVQMTTLVDIITRLKERQRLPNPSQSAHQVHWESYQPPPGPPQTPVLLAYVNFNLAPTAMAVEGANNWAVVASLLSLSQVNNIERLLQWSIYDRVTLISPAGAVLTGAVQPGQVLDEGVNVTRDGLVFKLVSPGAQHWTAIYVITLQRFLDYAFWPLLGLVALVLAMLGCSRAFNRWYKARVVLPAHQAHASIAESEAFSRAVIDTAPTGLWVIRRSDHHRLVQNQHARQWHDTRQLIDLLQQQPPTAPGQADLEIDGRHLHVAFVPTRYQGQDAWLCTAHDVTRHIEDAAALEDARQAADSANQAKSRFLATMSHEIRTPLYGVLGTLELLGLTPLAPRQQDYLHTIQRSSTTLFQLISDVLDVSKIESGQMTLELQDFCPLELTEDSVRTYSAFARSKGLQLYACIDAQLPARLRGDPLRLRQILNNLLSNAIKFTDNGRVVLRVRVLGSADGHVRLQWQVSDSGVGISPAQQPQLFDPFYQADDATSQAGAGLGLAICKWLCELMHGQLNVVSEPGLGSSFTLQVELQTLPGTLADCPTFSPGTPAVYIRGQVLEQAQHLLGWFERLGLDSRLAMADTPPSTALLVDLSPLPGCPPWPGQRVIALPGGPNPPQMCGADWVVDADDLRAIAWAVYLAQYGADADNRPALPAKARPLNLQVLVAEDNLINSAIIKEQLEALGCAVVLAANGEQALAQWLPGRFDLVLTDVNMPVMNGYQLAKALRQQDATLPIIGVTANALREEGERCADAGMNAWVVKPLNLATLRAQLEKHCKVAMPALVDTPQLSPKMRELFVSTLRQDVHTTLAALERNDANGVAQHLHSMAGALGAAQAGDMAMAFVELECRLTGLAMTPALALEVRQNLARLTTLLDALESSHFG
ncbi:response regulator [Pseudomonas gessardii]|uniref:histidine kinase n=2 Tax=Pseudomonas gessardii TaxID=78544 RepID=A0ABS9FCV8_9PSED|nr:ATP-binding protein [Pseudomonas gessardii]MCF4980069.1 response regulator [Pseudomonas gessardii]MCF5085186.1 response regulator [Pseudomonas gessardii]MCF5095045.1 response regulator [Pseudomonas gessardii]MCF5109280.1 response regulator [Pseudomonas gessardii]